MAKRRPASASLYKSDKFVFDLDFYMGAIRNPVWEKRPLKFPYVEDRDAANIDFLGESERRTYHGVIPKPGPREGQGQLFGNYSTRESFDFASGPNRFINSTQLFTLPDNVVATTSGLFELPEGTIHPDWFAPAIGNFEYIRRDLTNLEVSPQEHFMAKYPRRLSRFDGRPDDEYYPVHQTPMRIPRLFYFNHTTPPYSAPVRPDTNTKVSHHQTKWGNPRRRR